MMRMGDYHIVAALEAQQVRGRAAAAAVPTSIHALRPLRRAADTDIGAMLNLEELLVPVSRHGPGAAGERLWPGVNPARSAPWRVPRIRAQAVRAHWRVMPSTSRRAALGQT